MLRKIFQRKPKKINNPKKRYKYGIVSSLYGIITNLILFVAKLFVGIISGSIAVISDAINNLSDGVSAGVTLIGFKLSSKPADKDHPFGHARYEYISALIVAFLICIIGALLAKESIENIITPKETIVTWLLIVVMIVSVVIKISQYFINS